MSILQAIKEADCRGVLLDEPLPLGPPLLVHISRKRAAKYVLGRKTSQHIVEHGWADSSATISRENVLLIWCDTHRLGVAEGDTCPICAAEAKRTGGPKDGALKSHRMECCQQDLEDTAKYETTTSDSHLESYQAAEESYTSVCKTAHRRAVGIDAAECYAVSTLVSNELDHEQLLISTPPHLDRLVDYLTEEFFEPRTEEFFDSRTEWPDTNGACILCDEEHSSTPPGQVLCEQLRPVNYGPTLGGICVNLPRSISSTLSCVI